MVQGIQVDAIGVASGNDLPEDASPTGEWTLHAALDIGTVACPSAASAAVHVSPASGVAGLTRFTLSTSAWTDDSGGPLQFKFLGLGVNGTSHGASLALSDFAVSSAAPGVVSKSN
jgi:hypothetical protein